MQPYQVQNLITVSGFKARNPEIDVSAFDDPTVSGFISRASRAIQNYCNVDSFLTQDVVNETAEAVIDNTGNLLIYPRVRPLTVSGIHAIRLVKAGFSTNLVISGSNQTYFQVPYPYTSVVYPSSYLVGSGTLMIGGSSQLVTLKGAGVFYEIDYTGGYEIAPEDLQDACDLYVRDYLTRRMNPLGAQQVRQGSFSLSRQIRSSGQNSDMADSVYIQQAHNTLNDGGYVRTAFGG